MKKLIYLLFLLLIYQIQTAQEKLNISLFDDSLLNVKELNMNSEKKSFNEIRNIEINKITPLVLKVNSEGKFLLDDSSKALFVKIVKNNEARDNNNLDEENIALIVDTNQKFVTKVILDKLEEELNKLILLNESLTYGDRNIDLYRDYSRLENKLIITKQLSSELEIQIGNSIYPYLNKLQKTEIDKTLQNSLNLLAINF